MVRRKDDAMRMERPRDGVQKMNDESAARSLEELSAKESVAAHQATCGCHPQGECDSGPCELNYQTTPPHEDEQTHRYATDSAGQRWHLDPLCKVRPEARG